jgi:hypothetical protein
MPVPFAQPSAKFAPQPLGRRHLLSSREIHPVPLYRLVLHRRDRLESDRHALAGHHAGCPLNPGWSGHAFNVAAKARHIQPDKPPLSRLSPAWPRRTQAFPAPYAFNPEIRRSIRAETTRIESYNDFLDWVSFGGPVVKSGDPVEQEKQLKYASLVANAIMLSNVADMTEVLLSMAKDGHPATPSLVARLSPYTREHIRRFGQYVLDMDDLPKPLDPQPLPFEIAL